MCQELFKIAENTGIPLVRPIRDNHKQNADREKWNFSPAESTIRVVSVIGDRDDYDS